MSRKYLITTKTSIKLERVRITHTLCI